ncbi:MAG: 3-hydroxybutyryl-CoA dehydrogenase [Acidobacteria bacterium]|nr:3-hydroxybutyryl-CoA dehydrogenase [Acidobacteriota bacterium]
MDIQRISVLGAGTMGHGIAQVAAQAGYRTTLYDIEATLTQAGLDRITANLDKGVARGKVTEDQRLNTLGNLSATTDLEDAAQAELVIEAIPERLDLKREVFGTLDAHAPDDCILASNTSSLSIAEIAAATRRPAQILGMHFFNPVHIMALLEIVVHEGTADATLAAARDVAEKMNKTSIVVRDVPGFATSRLGIVLGLEAMRMVEQGVASAEDIDTAMELGYRHPMGPLKLTDLVGLDVRLGIAEYLHEQLGSDAFEPPTLLRKMVEDGKLGKKSGRGFYDWSED